MRAMFTAVASIGSEKQTANLHTKNQMKTKMLKMSEIRNSGGEASFSESYKFTLIHVESGKRKYTDRKPSLSYYSPFLSWDNKNNCEVPKRKK